MTTPTRPIPPAEMPSRLRHPTGRALRGAVVALATAGVLAVPGIASADTGPTYQPHSVGEAQTVYGDKDVTYDLPGYDEQGRKLPDLSRQFYKSYDTGVGIGLGTIFTIGLLVLL